MYSVARQEALQKLATPGQSGSRSNTVTSTALTGFHEIRKPSQITKGTIFVLVLAIGCADSDIHRANFWATRKISAEQLAKIIPETDWDGVRPISIVAASEMPATSFGAGYHSKFPRRHQRGEGYLLQVPCRLWAAARCCLPRLLFSTARLLCRALWQAVGGARCLCACAMPNCNRKGKYKSQKFQTFI